jgi:hypothetical protein
MKTSLSKWWILIILMLGLLAGTLVSAMMNRLALDQSRVSWQRLPDPPERVAKILGLIHRTGSMTVAVLSQSGNIYSYKTTLPSSWQATSNQNLWSGIKCQDTSSLPSVVTAALPGKMVDCITSFQWEWGNERWVYALFQDGSLWRWHYHYGADTYITYVCGGPLVGLLLGAGICLWVWMKRNASLAILLTI